MNTRSELIFADLLAIFLLFCLGIYLTIGGSYVADFVPPAMKDFVHAAVNWNFKVCMAAVALVYWCAVTVFFRRDWYVDAGTGRALGVGRLLLRCTFKAATLVVMTWWLAIIYTILIEKYQFILHDRLSRTRMVVKLNTDAIR